MEASAEAGDGARILIIEDDATQQTYLTEVLTMAGHESRAASNCAEGRDLFQHNDFEILFVDLGLPDGSGLDLLSEFAAESPELVAIVLTGDGSPETIISTMRAGAFDYLTKPVDLTTLRAALKRAVAHSSLVRERSDLLRLLLEEREQLRARIEEATADIRQYAHACEVNNDRLRSLLRLTQVGNNSFTEESLMRAVFDEVSAHFPLVTVALCDVTRQRLTGVLRASQGGAPRLFRGEETGAAGYDTLLAQAEPELTLRTWLERHTGVTTEGLKGFVFPQSFWNRALSTVGFYLEGDAEFTAVDEEFLGMVASYAAFEWEQAKLLLQVAHQASLGGIGVELARNFVQPLTAIRTAADVVDELNAAPEVAEGMRIIQDNVERLRRQTQEFRRLSLTREGSIETVHLAEYIDQAIDLLSVAMQSRGVTIVRDYAADSECVILNGTALARVFLTLLLGALRSVAIGGSIHVQLTSDTPDNIQFEMSYASNSGGGAGPDPDDLLVAHLSSEARHPGLQLAERTVHSCGGTLAIGGQDGTVTLKMVLPRHATDSTAGEVRA